MDTWTSEDRNMTAMQNTTATPTDGAYTNLANVTANNYTDTTFQDDYLFDRTDVRVIFITLYSIVFSCCFFGKFCSMHAIN